MTLFSLIFAGAIVIGTTKQKEIFTYSHFLKTNKKQNKTTKYVQEGKGYVDFNFFNFVSHCMCKSINQ